MKKKAIARILVISVACLAFGCGKKEDGNKDAEKSKTELSGVQEVRADKKQYKTIGQETENAYKLLLTNHTGGEITGFAIKASTAQTGSGNLLQSGMKIGLDETVCVYYTPEEEHPAQTAYDFQLSYADGHAVEIAGIGLDGMEQAEMCFEDEVGFIKYINKDSGKEVSTKEMAVALKAQKQAQSAAEELAKKEDAQQGAAQADTSSQYDQTAYNQPTYSQPTYNQPADNQPVPDQPADNIPADSGGQGQDVNQSGEGCLDNPVINPDAGQTGEDDPANDNSSDADQGTGPDNGSDSGSDNSSGTGAGSGSDVNQSGEGCLDNPVINPGVDQSGEGCLGGGAVTNPNYSSGSN